MCYIPDSQPWRRMTDFRAIICFAAVNLLARKLSANYYDIYHCCVYSEKLLMMDGGTVRNIKNFIPKINLRK